MKDEGLVKEIPAKSGNFSEWYTAVVLKAELADYAPVRGCMVIRPYGYALWENMQARLDARFKATGHVNAYFPTLIPESFLKKEAEHVKGFSPQVAWVTRGGDADLTEPLALRPTSEAIINYMYARWVRSYRDLPVLINQWCNIFRWEKTTRLFLRTLEFLWQEGHTLHRTQEEAQEETLRILNIYVDFVENDLGVPVIAGQKPESEKFPGALATYSIEALMPDGQALQAGTSHNLGQNFTRAFDIRYLDEDNTEKYPWGTSWGVSSRLIGAVIMTHGDDKGLFLPPRVAPVQVVIVPILYGKEDEAVLSQCRKVREMLSLFRVKLDDRLQYTAGWKFNEYEMRGVPLRIEVGPRDVKNGQVVLVPRDGSGKLAVSLEQLVDETGKLLDQIQRNMLERARQWVMSVTTSAETIEEFKRNLAEKPGFVKVHWCGAQECENRLIDETKTTPRNMPLNEQDSVGKCIICGKETKTLIYYARTY
ncbi:MAG: proline--tRNA ligase [candidate division WOR-3 bacterium]|uniref:Proline--tRNA ligase n=2 Tax=candidate division WOR-3 bacterium TaxID=2052148 RepID=A0A7C3IZ66_UNCW3|nr:proline--tRNA ligase [candidate division WOR-3 bacterium]